jgi:hypothetical protein
MDTTRERSFTLLPNVRRDPARAHDRFAIAKGVPLVEAAVPRSPHATADAQHNGIEGSGEGPFVVEIRAT